MLYFTKITKIYQLYCNNKIMMKKKNKTYYVVSFIHILQLQPKRDQFLHSHAESLAETLRNAVCGLIRRNAWNQTSFGQKRY